MDQESQAKWEWSVSASVKKATAEQLWPFLKDFFNIHKWFPGMETSYGVHGNNGEVGCTRHNPGLSMPSVDGSTSWATERLTAIDPSQKIITFEIIDSNIGFNSYVSTIKICPASGDEGSVMWWCVTVDPIKGWRMEELMRNYETVLKIMAKKMEDDALREF